MKFNSMCIDFVKSHDSIMSSEMPLGKTYGYIGCKDIIRMAAHLLNNINVNNETLTVIRRCIGYRLKDMEIENKLGPISYGRKKVFKHYFPSDTEKRNIDLLIDSIIANIILYSEEFPANFDKGVPFPAEKGLTTEDLDKISTCLNWACDWVKRELYLWEEELDDVVYINKHELNKLS